MADTFPVVLGTTVVSGGTAGSGDGAIIDGVDAGLKATVVDLADSNPLAVAIVDGSGDQITSFGGGTQYTEGDTDASITGTAILWEDAADTLRAVSAAKPLPVGDAGGSLTVDATNLDIRDLAAASDSVTIHGDVGIVDQLDLATTNPLAVAVVDGTGAQITSFGGGVQYTEGDTDASITGTALMMEGSVNTLVSARGTAADGLLVNLGSNNDVTVEPAADVTNTDTLDNLNDTVFLALQGRPGLSVLYTTSDFDGTFVFEGSVDGGVTFQTDETLIFYWGHTPLLTWTGSGAAESEEFSIMPLSAMSHVRARVDTYTSGSATIQFRAGQQLNPPMAGATFLSSQPATSSLGLVIREAARGQATMAASIPVVVASDQAPVEVFATSMPLPSDASTATQQGLQTTALQIIDDPIATLGTTTYTEAVTRASIIGAVRRDADTTLVNTTNEIAPLQVDANGRLKVEAFSGEDLPVTLASTTVTGTVAVTQSGTWDEVGINDSGNSITVDGTVATTNPANTVATGTLTANAQTVSITVPNGASSVTLQITGSFSGDVNFEATTDGTTWVTIPGVSLLLGDIFYATTVPDIVTFASATLSNIRVRATSWVSGTADIRFLSNTGVSSVSITSALPTGVNHIGLVTATISSGTVQIGDGFNQVVVLTAGADDVANTENELVTGAMTYAFDGTSWDRVRNGGGTEATAMRVTIASDSTGVLSVDDNGASLTVDGSGTFTVGGVVAHDTADSGNPVPVGGVAVSGSATPTSVAAADRTRWIFNQHGIPYVLGGHPNLITREYDFGTAAQTDTNLAAAVVAADERIYVTRFEALCDNANTVAVAVRAGFGTANTPAASSSGVSGMIGSHPGIAAGSGIMCGNGAGIIAVGGAGEEPRLTTSAATSGNLHVVFSYFLVDETP